MDAMEAAIQILEDLPVFDAGRGSYLTTDGVVEMDAIVMDGATLQMGATAGVQHVRHPITLARRIMERAPHNMLISAGAESFARECGLELCAAEWFETPYTRAVWQEYGRLPLLTGTVGCVARDSTGTLVAGTSTGGTDHKLPGRVGDVPLVGSGAYADNRSAAASATGEGDMIMRVVLSKTACDLAASGMPAAAVAQAAIATLAERTGGTAGIIIIDRSGRTGFAHNTKRMSRAWIDADGVLQAGIELAAGSA